jgi:hypothetical protein
MQGAFLFFILLSLALPYAVHLLVIYPINLIYLINQSTFTFTPLNIFVENERSGFNWGNQLNLLNQHNQLYYILWPSTFDLKP